jgi:hypothetical protein
MKRTRQVFHYDQDKVPTDISGCRQFHGEDLRKSMQQFPKKKWDFLDSKYSMIWKSPLLENSLSLTLVKFIQPSMTAWNTKQRPRKSGYSSRSQRSVRSCNQSLRRKSKSKYPPISYHVDNWNSNHHIVGLTPSRPLPSTAWGACLRMRCRPNARPSSRRSNRRTNVWLLRKSSASTSGRRSRSTWTSWRSPTLTYDCTGEREGSLRACLLSRITSAWITAWYKIYWLTTVPKPLTPHLETMPIDDLPQKGGHG